MLKNNKKRWENIFCFLVFYTFILFSSKSFSADSLSYSGRLVKVDGSPVTGQVNLKVDLAYTDFPNTILCSQNFSSVVLSNGVFHLKLDLVCPGPPAKTVTEILSAVPATFSAALRVSDLSNNKIYAFQEIHSMPFATISGTAKQLAQLGAVNGEVLKWNDTTKKWEPSASGGGGTVTNVSVSAPMAVASGATTPALTISKATTTTDGYLSAIDWNAFNNKVGVTTGGTTSQFYRGDNSWQTLNTDAVPVGVTNLYFTNALALGVPLGATLDVINLAGAISSADTFLTAFGRAQKQINLINANSSAYVTKTGTSTLVAGTIDAQAGFVLVGAPGSINDATPRGYVDTQVGLKLSKAGDTMSGALTLNSDLLIKGGSNYVTLKGHATSAAYNFILPSNAGLVGEVLKTDGAGNLSWVNPTSLAAGSATVDSIAIVNGTIVDADISNTTISYNKLNLTDGDIPLAKLNGVIDASKYLRGDKSWQALNGAAVINTPAGSIGATTIQAAINELDAEKEPSITTGLASDYYKGNKTWSNLETDVRASQLTGLAAGTNTAIVATDSILSAFQNTQAQINNKQNAISKSSVQDVSKLRIYGANVTNYVELSAATLTANRTLVFPDANGTSGQVLTTDGAGILSWSSAATTATSVGGDLTGSIANAQLAAGVVGTNELATDAVTSTKILDGTIVDADMANATITYAKLNLGDGDIPPAKLNGTSDATKYLRGDKSWASLATDAINSALSGFTPYATKTDIAAGDSIFTAFRKTQKQLDDIDGDYVSKSGNNTVSGTFNISGIAAFINIPTPNGTTLTEAANVDYVKTYVAAMGQWTKGSGANTADIYFNTGKVGVGTATPASALEVVGTATATAFSGSGSLLTNLNATNLTSGTVPTAQLGSGTANSATFLRGDNTWQPIAAAGTAVAPSFYVTKSGIQTVPNTVQVKLTFDVVSFDTNNNWSAVNNRYTPTIAGKYIINLSAYCPDNTSYCQVFLFKNGLSYSQNFSRGTSNQAELSIIMDMNGTTDYLEAFIINSGGTQVGVTQNTFFTGALIAPLASGSVAGTGTANNIPMWSNSTNLTNSPLAVSAGNVGIGTPTPISTLNIKSTNNTGYLGGVSFTEFSNTNYWSIVAKNNGYLYFGNDNGVNGLSDRITFSPIGNVGIGTTSPGVALDVAGTIRSTTGSVYANTAVFSNDRINFSTPSYYVLNGVSVGVILANGATSWAAQSDRRLKKDIRPLEYALDKINHINGVTYNYKVDPKSEPRRVGVIAQEVKAVLPEAVSEDKKGFLSVRYSEIVPLTINAIKELYKLWFDDHHQIEELKAENAELREAVCEINPKAKVCGHKQSIGQ